jgi:hypothetical protein
MTKDARRRWNPTRALYLDEIDWGDGAISRIATASNGPTSATTHASKAFIASPSSSFLNQARSNKSTRPESTRGGRRFNHAPPFIGAMVKTGAPGNRPTDATSRATQNAERAPTLSSINQVRPA